MSQEWQWCREKRLKARFEPKSWLYTNLITFCVLLYDAYVGIQL